MKFEPLVKVVENKLVKISDNSEISTENLNIVQADCLGEQPVPAAGTLTAVVCPWSMVEFDGGYNEEFLAALRESLKKFEAAGAFAFVVPQARKSFSDADEADLFIKAMVHAARRIKDCGSVLGFAVASELMEKDAGKKLDGNSWTEWFISEMNVKHGHYVYFAGKSNIKKYGLLPHTSLCELVLY